MDQRLFLTQLDSYQNTPIKNALNQYQWMNGKIYQLQDQVVAKPNTSGLNRVQVVLLQSLKRIIAINIAESKIGE